MLKNPLSDLPLLQLVARPESSSNSSDLIWLKLRLAVRYRRGTCCAITSLVCIVVHLCLALQIALTIRKSINVN